MSAIGNSLLECTIAPLVVGWMLCLYTIVYPEFFDKHWHHIMFGHSILTIISISMWTLAERRILFDTKAQQKCIYASDSPSTPSIDEPEPEEDETQLFTIGDKNSPHISRSVFNNRKTGKRVPKSAIHRSSRTVLMKRKKNQ